MGVECWTMGQASYNSRKRDSSESALDTQSYRYRPKELAIAPNWMQPWHGFGNRKADEMTNSVKHVMRYQMRRKRWQPCETFMLTYMLLKLLHKAGLFFQKVDHYTCLYLYLLWKWSFLDLNVGHFCGIDLRFLNQVVD